MSVRGVVRQEMDDGRRQCGLRGHKGRKLTCLIILSKINHICLHLIVMGVYRVSDLGQGEKTQCTLNILVASAFHREHREIEIENFAKTQGGFVSSNCKFLDSKEQCYCNICHKTIKFFIGAKWVYRGSFCI